MDQIKLKSRLCRHIRYMSPRVSDKDLRTNSQKVTESERVEFPSATQVKISQY